MLGLQLGLFGVCIFVYTACNKNGQMCFKVVKCSLQNSLLFSELLTLLATSAKDIDLNLLFFFMLT